MTRRKTNIVMVGPDIEGLGGISRVARIWRNGSIFSENKVKYISTVTEKEVNQWFYLLKAFASFVVSIHRGHPLVYVHTPAYNGFRRKALFLAFALLLRKKVILHIHSGYFYKFLIGLKGAEKKLIFFLLHRLNAFIVLSEEMRANIQGFLPHKPIYVLRNPINVKSAQISDHHIRAQSKLLYLGWYITEKGVYDLVDAISILTSRGAEINLEFYGTKQIKKLQSYVKSKGLEGVISVNGWIDGPEKSAALHQATALVLPSYSEGIPNVILEAMATKTPIISTLVGGLKEILQDEENAIIAEPGNPKDLSEKILKCIKDEELRNKIASKAYDDVVTKYDIAIIKKELSLILEQFSHSAPTAI